MTHYSTKRITAIWGILVGLTIFSVTCLQSLGSDNGHRLGAASVITIAFLKVRIVGLEYMELGSAPVLLRFLFEAWVIAIYAAIMCAALLVR
jgi:hypothetical protein